MKHHKTVEQAVIKFIAKNQLLIKPCKLLIGLSGGADSVFAIHFLNKYAKKFRIKLAALHVNHNLRGDESKRDEIFCENLCQGLKIEYFSTKVDVDSYAKTNKKSLEEAGRELRYSIFLETAVKCDADYIVTAHNNDDNAETVLLNLLSGSGIDGISGIPVKRDNVIRPFLVLSKDEIVEYLESHNLDYVQDSSNDNIDYRRNFLRKKVLPVLKQNINPALSKVILNSSEILKNQSKILRHYTMEAYGECVSDFNNGAAINLKKVSGYPKELLSEIFKMIFIKKLSLDFSFNNAEKLNELILSQVGTRANLGKNVFALRERSKLIISKDVEYGKYNFVISIGEKVKLSESSFSIRKISRLPKKFSPNPMIEYIEGDNIKGKMKLRSWKKGDKIQLLGMKGTKKISDVLTDLKVSNIERKKKIVLEHENDIIWLIGHRISEKYKVKKTTNTILKLCLD